MERVNGSSIGVRIRIVLGVTAAWLLVAVVWASQTVLAANLQGNAVAAGPALRTALLQTTPWIPVTLAIVGLAHRFPVRRATWRRTLPLHIVAFPLLLFVENVLVVVGFQLSRGALQAPAAVLQGGLVWTLSRLHVGALLYTAIAAATQAAAYYRESRARELRVARLESQLTRARLDALTAQIRPHFLFNTLHTIGQLWRSGHAEEADAMLDHLGALFQRVRRSTMQPLVSLDDELDMVEDYLAIEAARFRDRLRTEVRADDDARACGVPPLLLQPLVENAVRHGIAASSAAGRVTVTGTARNGRLVIEIGDDGPGFRDGPLTDGAGTGLRNTRERLAQAFGADHRFEILGGAAGGTRIRIELPAIACGDDDAAVESPATSADTSASSNSDRNAAAAADVAARARPPDVPAPAHAPADARPRGRR
jgi:two-component system, LytTR family, sensor kinase